MILMLYGWYVMTNKNKKEGVLDVLLFIAKIYLILRTQMPEEEGKE